MVSLLLTRTELDFLLERREFTKPQKRCIRSRLNKKVKEFADNELPILIEKGLLDGKGFEPTSPITTMVRWGRFGLAAHAITDYTTNNLMRSLDMAGVVGSTPTRPTLFLSSDPLSLEVSNKPSPVCGGILIRLSPCTLQFSAILRNSAIYER